MDKVVRFQAKVMVNPDTGCWEWQGSKVRGYGQFWDEGKLVLSHRFAYVNWVGPVPEGKELDHLCRNRACCNPSHLEPVTRKENMQRAPVNLPKPFCLHGHPQTPENVRYCFRRGDYRRVCKVCASIQDKEYRKHYVRKSRAKNRSSE
ncbi:HNH endonuclease signature motif containing protein [Mesoterricola sediminis]|uniref:HNH endonuclease signature motif containing protein n=1 Tax=Mesoterricola sediminis TaxID=2927980 RepID=UPI00292F8C63|nr:HNH endonuclease signature motif containing protein [Mesoterricola sediminis]